MTLPDDELEKLAESYADDCDIEKRFGGPRLEREIGFIAGFRAAEKMMQDRWPSEDEALKSRRQIAAPMLRDMISRGQAIQMMFDYELWLKQKMFNKGEEK